jgi:hypothetical protein
MFFNKVLHKLNIRYIFATKISNYIKNPAAFHLYSTEPA